MGQVTCSQTGNITRLPHGITESELFVLLNLLDACYFPLAHLYIPSRKGLRSLRYKHEFSNFPA